MDINIIHNINKRSHENKQPITNISILKNFKKNLEIKFSKNSLTGGKHLRFFYVEIMEYQ
jgi:hypothetical protein